LHPISKNALILSAFLQKEHIDVRRVELRLFLALKRAHLPQEITRAQLEVVVEDQDRTVILKRPNLRVEFRVLVFHE
jgi:hypothetical protein